MAAAGVSAAAAVAFGASAEEAGAAAVFAARFVVTFVSPFVPSPAALFLAAAAAGAELEGEEAEVVVFDGAASGAPVAAASDCGASAEPAGAGAEGCAPTAVFDLFSRSFAKVPSLPGPWGPRLERCRRRILCVWRLARADVHSG